MVLLCHVISQGHVMKGLNDIIDKILIAQIITLQSLVVISILVEELNFILVYHVISKDYVIKRSCDFAGWVVSLQVNNLLCIVAIGIVVVKI